MPQPPNILWVCTDQQRWDTIASLGNPHIRTPNVDRLVGEGVAFTHAFCQSTVCTPSRASFLTGRYPRTTRCRQNGQTIPADEKLISRIFTDAGYVCGLAGKQHLSSCSDGKVEIRQDDGYDTFEWSHHPQPDWKESAYAQWLASKGKTWAELYNGPATPYVKHGIPTEFHQTTWCAERAAAFVKEHRDRPWLFSYNCFAPHHPFDPPAEYLERYDPADMPLPKHRSGELENKPHYQKLDHEYAHNDPSGYRVVDMSEDDQRHVTAAYYAMIEHIDDAVGAMVGALEDSGQLENTIVIFMSDHGEMLGDHGIYLKGPHFYEAAVRVPLVLRWPEKFQRELQSDALIELVDLAPTLLQACGVDVPGNMRGRSLLPICTGQADPAVHRDYVYCEYYNAWTHHRSYGTMMRTRDKKVGVYHGVNEGELYDLAEDPDEFDNLWEQPVGATLQHGLLKQAFDASVFTMDPWPPRLGPL